MRHLILVSSGCQVPLKEAMTLPISVLTTKTMPIPADRDLLLHRSVRLLPLHRQGNTLTVKKRRRKTSYRSWRHTVHHMLRSLHQTSGSLWQKDSKKRLRQRDHVLSTLYPHVVQSGNLSQKTRSASLTLRQIH